MNIRQNAIKEFFLYATASVIALGADVGSLVLLVQIAQLNYLVAASVAFSIGAAITYFLSTRYVFAVRSCSDPRLEFMIFVLIGLGGLLLNAAVMAFVVQRLHYTYMIGKTCAVGLTFTFNFSVRKMLLFDQRSHVKSLARQPEIS